MIDDKATEPIPDALDRALADCDPMWLCAMVLGYNEMARHAKTLGDKIYFRLHRDTLHEYLKKRGGGWQVEFGAKPDDCDTK